MILFGSNTFAGHTARSSRSSVVREQCEGACSAVVDAPSVMEGERRFESGRSRSPRVHVFVESANHVVRPHSGTPPRLTR